MVTCSAGFIHPLAIVESRDVGEGTKIWAHAHVMSGAKIGRSCNIGEGVFIESDATIGDGVTIKNGVSVWSKVTLENDVFVGPGVTFTNDLLPRAFDKKGKEAWLPTVIKIGTTLGAGSIILCNLEIGTYAFIAAGTLVTKSVPAFAFLKGSPGRVVGYVCKCLSERCENNPEENLKVCKKCGFNYNQWKRSC